MPPMLKAVCTVFRAAIKQTMMGSNGIGDPFRRQRFDAVCAAGMVFFQQKSDGCKGMRDASPAHRKSLCASIQIFLIGPRHFAIVQFSAKLRRLLQPNAFQRLPCIAGAGVAMFLHSLADSFAVRGNSNMRVECCHTESSIAGLGVLLFADDWDYRPDFSFCQYIITNIKTNF